MGVMLYDYFLAQYPDGKRDVDYSNSDANYSFSQFKNELEEALVSYFGRAAVKRGNKAFDIKATVSHVEADVIPLFEFRQYWDAGGYRAGVALVPDNGSRRASRTILSAWLTIGRQRPFTMRTESQKTIKRTVDSREWFAS